MAPRKPNPWRDLAETITAQVNDAIQQGRRNSGRGGHGGSNWGHGNRSSRDASSPYLSWDDQPPEDDRSSQHRQQWQPEDRAARPYQQPAERSRISSSDLSGELRGLLAETVGATTRSLQERREERRRTEPIRKARGASLRNKVGAGLFGLVALGFGGAAVDLATDGEAAPAAIGGVVSVGSAGVAFGSARRARRATKQADSLESQLASPSSPYLSTTAARTLSKPLPPQSSAAYEPMRRLLAQERVLQQMVPEISAVAPDIAEIAAASEQSLEQLAGRIVLLENAVGAAGGTDSEVTDNEYGGLRQSLQRLVDRLGDGVAAHERLIGAAASVIVEMSTPTPGPTPITGLREAADGLQALATGLREVSRPHLDLSDPHRPTSALDDVPDYGAPRPDKAKRRPDALGDH